VVFTASTRDSDAIERRRSYSTSSVALFSPSSISKSFNISKLITCFLQTRHCPLSEHPCRWLGCGQHQQTQTRCSARSQLSNGVKIIRLDFPTGFLTMYKGDRPSKYLCCGSGLIPRFQHFWNVLIFFLIITTRLFSLRLPPPKSWLPPA
jgi:hypothetical protein